MGRRWRPRERNPENRSWCLRGKSLSSRRAGRLRADGRRPPGAVVKPRWRRGMGRSLPMDRMAILWLILVVLTGCQGPTTPIDPFATYGPSRIPPPATGSARRGDPYYRGSLASSAPSAASTSGIAAQGVPVMSRFTSEDPGSGAVEMADRRAADTSPVTGNGPSSSTRRLDWRSPTSDSQSYLPSSDAVAAPTLSLDFCREYGCRGPAEPAAGAAGTGSDHSRSARPGLWAKRAGGAGRLSTAADGLARRRGPLLNPSESTSYAGEN